MAAEPRPAADGDAHDHGHSHIHDHSAIAWSAFRTSPLLGAVLVGVVLAAIATVVAVIALWPTGVGKQEAIERGSQVGLGSQRYAATVSEVIDGPCSYSTTENPQECRLISVEVTEDPFAGEERTFIEFNRQFDLVPEVEVGEAVLAGYEPSTDFWFFAEQDRRTPMLVLAVIFAVVVIALGRFRGVAALVGMAATVVVLVFFVAPSVLDGNDPLFVAVVAAALIAFVSLYLTHGFNPTTTVALAGTLLSLGLTLALTAIFFRLSSFTGFASEEALLLPFVAGEIELSRLLLGGAVLGTLGALDDVTVTQVATVAELHRRSPRLSVPELTTSGIRVGREHIASTVNTLLLAYAGASMPLLLLFAVSDLPLAKVANRELVAIEIVRTLSGSVGLVAAVPITTVLAALITRRVRTHEDEDEDEAGEGIEDGGTEAPADRANPIAASDPAQSTSSADTPPAASSPPAEPEPEEPPAPPAPPSWDDFAPDETREW